jgi:hypothetical protein
VSSESEDEEDDLDFSENRGQTVEEFTFEFNDMREGYFHGIRTLLLQTIVSTAECSKLSDIIVAQCKLLY